MNAIEIKEDFIINGEKVKIISGALHYFRIIKEYWSDSLDNLKNMGCNTVETYIPWNYHEKEIGEFNFTENHDIASFIKLAADKELYVILRPSPYICAEWEFGGLPYWLLNDKEMRIRSSDKRFLGYVKKYYEKLMPVITPFQIDRGGPVIMMQLENEYGSYGNDKEYLKELLKIMKNMGVTVPIFTSDGTWEEALEAGTLLNENVFPTGNFGSKSEENISNLEAFKSKHKIKAPIMCMEFWVGWFGRWGEKIIKRDPVELTNVVKEMLNLGSINLYMFQGGTNFGFMNGCSARGNHDLHQISSYDYDAILTEWGDKTEKYRLIQSILINEDKLVNETFKMHNKKKYGAAELKESVSLFNTLETLAVPIKNKWPLSMEDVNQGYGYILYKSNIGKKRDISKIRIIEASDRVQVFMNEEHVITQLKEEIGSEIELKLQRDDDNELSILVENMGRVNYGSKLLVPTQRKGIRNGVMIDLHFQADWDHYSLELNNINKINFSKEYISGPGFHRYELEVEECQDTFIDCRGFGKGCMFINGFNLGRFWEVGPNQYLYLPAPLLKKGINEIIVFETEGKYKEQLKLLDYPVYSEIKEE